MVKWFLAVSYKRTISGLVLNFPRLLRDFFITERSSDNKRKWACDERGHEAHFRLPRRLRWSLLELRLCRDIRSCQDYFSVIMVMFSTTVHLFTIYFLTKVLTYFIILCYNESMDRGVPDRQRALERAVAVFYGKTFIP